MGFLLFVVGFGALAAGILIGRYYVPDDRALKRTAKHADAYMAALNAVLSRDNDEAVDQLKSAVKEDVSDIEPYFALGALFRNRGEWERAIRVHQAIELRTDSDKDTRLRARFELGLDFRAAGMPRRATRAMEECLTEDSEHEGALAALCSLYEEQGRYAEAATAWRRLDKANAGSYREQHLLAAGAQLAIEQLDFDRAKRLVREAEKFGEDNPHVHVAASLLSMAEDDARSASTHLIRAIACAPDLSGFLVPLLYDTERQVAQDALGGDPAPAPARLPAKRPAQAAPQAHVGPDEDEWGAGAASPDAAGSDDASDAEPDASDAEPDAQPAGLGPDSGPDIAGRAAQETVAALHRIMEQTGRDPYLLLALAELRSHYDVEQALEDYRSVAVENPGLLPARVAAARLALASGDPDEIQSELRALASSDGALSWASDGVWRCENCGHREQDFFWRCPRCRRWGDVHLDMGRAAQDPEPPEIRDRRRAPRRLALPRPTIDPGALLDQGDVQEHSFLGRASQVISGVWRRVRGRGE